MTVSSGQPRPQAPPGLTVGGYTLLTRLGEGGMGVVHLARKPGGERVALKVLRPHIVGDDEARARLAREVSSLSRIRSRWVAEIVDADPWGPVPFVATRYVPGYSLHDQVQEEGPVRGADLIWLARSLAEGIASVHAAGVLHRDVKPSNVLMEGRTPILIDFGLARVADDPKLTHTGWLLGTPGYLPPEILHGDDATPASDVHSWAATVAYAGLGRSPYGSGPSMAIMDRVRRGDHDLTGLPDALRQVVDAALDPDPARRPSLDEIRSWLNPDNDAVTARIALLPDQPPEEAEDLFTMPLAIAAQAGLAPVAPETAVTGVRPTLVDPEPPERGPRRICPQPREGGLLGRPLARPPSPAGARLGGATAGAAGAAGRASPPDPPAGGRRGRCCRRGRGLPLPRRRRPAAAGLAAAQRVDGRECDGGPAADPWRGQVVRRRRSRRCRRPGTSSGRCRRPSCSTCGPAASQWRPALLCYAFSVSLELGLFISGLGLVGALYLGPGGSRVRRPLARLVVPLSRTVPTWGLALAAVLLAGLVLGLVSEAGVHWAPASGAPFR